LYIFLNSLLYFSEFSCPGRVWTEFEIKIFFFSDSAYLIPVLAENNAVKRFFSFLNFFAIFFGIFLPGSSKNGIRDKNSFPAFSAYLIKFWQKIMPWSGFIIFSIFLLFFSEFSCPGRVRTEFGTTFFFPFLGLTHPVLVINNAGKRSYNFWNSFTIFFGIFLPGSSMNGIRD